MKDGLKDPKGSHIRIGGHRVLLIVNPISGTRSKSGLENAFSASMRRSGANFEIARTEKAGDARRYAKEAVDEDYVAVVVAGGDGTVNEVGSSLIGSKTALGLLPCGSGNGLARTVGVPQEVDMALRLIEDGFARGCDCGMANGIPFFCTFGLGFDAAVAEKFAASPRRGYMSYIRSALEELISYRPSQYCISIGGREITSEAFIIAVCNTSQYGNNIYVAPEADITDGKLDITVIHSSKPLDLAVAGMSMVSGIIAPGRVMGSLRTPEVTITRDCAGPVQIDGEPMEMGTRIDIRCLPSALTIFSSETHPFIPVITPLKGFITDLGSNIRYAVSSIAKK